MGIKSDNQPDEYLDVLDQNGEKTGERKLRSAVHRDGDWHRTVHIWLVNPRGEILLQRRTLTKKTHPGMLDVSCAGHLLAGDTPKSGALRELAEELGVAAKPEQLQFLATIQRAKKMDSGITDKQYIDIFLLQTELELQDFELQMEEVADVQYVSPAELKQMIAEGKSDLADRGEEYEILFRTLETIQNK